MAFEEKTGFYFRNIIRDEPKNKAPIIKNYFFMENISKGNHILIKNK